MQTSDTTTRIERLAVSAAKPLLALAVLLGTMALSGTASAGPLYPPVITGVSPSTSVCPGQVLTLTGNSGPWGFGGPGFQAQFRLVGGQTTIVVPVTPPIVNTTGTDTTQVTVPASLTYGAVYDLWLSRSYTGGAGPAVQIRILRGVQCAIVANPGTGSAGPGVPAPGH
jgi:hypothetical protein